MKTSSIPGLKLFLLPFETVKLQKGQTKYPIYFTLIYQNMYTVVSGYIVDLET